jgi:hypothetical protein
LVLRERGFQDLAFHVSQCSDLRVGEQSWKRVLKKLLEGLRRFCCPSRRLLFFWSQEPANLTLIKMRDHKGQEGGVRGGLSENS